MRLPIREEELVITKRWVVKEVLVIRKRVVEEMRHVEADLRKERLDVERVDSDGRGEPGRAGRNPNDGR